MFNLMPLLSAQTAGDQLNANLDATKASTQLQMQALAQGQLNMKAAQDAQAQRQASQQQIQQMMNGWQQQDQQDRAQRVQDGKEPDLPLEQQYSQQSQRYRELGKSYLLSDPAMAENYQKMADATDGRLQNLQTQNLKIQHDKVSNLGSFAGGVLDGSHTPQEAFDFVKSNFGLQAAMQIPTDPDQAKLFWKGKQTDALTAQQQIENAQSVQDAKDKSDAADQAHEDRVEARRQRAADAAAQRELLKSRLVDAADARADRAAANKQNSDFRQSNKLNTDLTRQAKPYLDDMQRLDEVEGLLRMGNPAADQQARQSLTSLLGNFKGRATNQYYKDNKNYGDLVNRFTGALSHNFTGQYQDSDRQSLLGMIHGMRENVVAPSLSSMERGAKQRAQGYGLDPDMVEINSDFTRAPAASAKPTEGQTAVGPNNHTIVFKNGRWVDQ